MNFRCGPDGIIKFFSINQSIYLKVNFQLLKLISTLIRTHTAGDKPYSSPVSTQRSYSTQFHPFCLQSNSPLSAQRSSSTPAGGQPHPSPPSGHIPPHLLQSNPPNPAVILYPCRHLISPLASETGVMRRETR